MNSRGTAGAWRSQNPRRRATTLVEMCVVLLVLALLAGLALPRLRDATDRAAARGAIEEAGSMFSMARRAAITRRAVVAVVMDEVTGAIVVRVGATVIAQSGLRAQFGVRLLASRDSMSYDPR